MERILRFFSFQRNGEGLLNMPAGLSFPTVVGKANLGHQNGKSPATRRRRARMASSVLAGNFPTAKQTFPCNTSAIQKNFEELRVADPTTSAAPAVGQAAVPAVGQAAAPAAGFVFGAGVSQGHATASTGQSAVASADQESSGRSFGEPFKSVFFAAPAVPVGQPGRVPNEFSNVRQDSGAGIATTKQKQFSFSGSVSPQVPLFSAFPNGFGITDLSQQNGKTAPTFSSAAVSRSDTAVSFIGVERRRKPGPEVEADTTSIQKGMRELRVGNSTTAAEPASRVVYTSGVKDPRALPRNGLSTVASADQENSGISGVPQNLPSRSSGGAKEPIATAACPGPIPNQIPPVRQESDAGVAATLKPTFSFLGDVSTQGFTVVNNPIFSSPPKAPDGGRDGSGKGASPLQRRRTRVPPRRSRRSPRRSDAAATQSSLAGPSFSNPGIGSPSPFVDLQDDSLDMGSPMDLSPVRPEEDDDVIAFPQKDEKQEQEDKKQEQPEVNVRSLRSEQQERLERNIRPREPEGNIPAVNSSVKNGKHEELSQSRAESGGAFLGDMKAPQFNLGAGGSSTPVGANPLGSSGIRKHFSRRLHSAVSPQRKKNQPSWPTNSEAPLASQDRLHTTFSLKKQSGGTVPANATGDAAGGSEKFGHASAGGMNSKISGASVAGGSGSGANFSSPSDSSFLLVQKNWDSWKEKGNTAHNAKKFAKAEEYYTRGLQSVEQYGNIGKSAAMAAIFRSNRAASRVNMGRLKEALEDCRMAINSDSTYSKARLRAASCYLMVGNTQAAAVYLEECQRQQDGQTFDPKIAEDATDLWKRLRIVETSLARTQELMKGGVNGAADYSAALNVINEGMNVAGHCEQFFFLKAQSLLALRRYEDVLRLCEESLDLAASNSSLGPNAGEEGALSSAMRAKTWRWWMQGKALFCMGKMEESLEVLAKVEEDRGSSRNGQIGEGKEKDARDLAAAIQELLGHKMAGNAAFQAKNHVKAVEHYSAALAATLIRESRPFNAIIFCNRAAASQALGHISDAIADCSRAIALDPKYAKALSRRATLYETIRDYSQVVADLQRLVGLMEQSGSSSFAGQLQYNSEISQARDRLSKAETEFKKEHPLDHYLLLGVPSTAAESEIKKAYRKAALRHHPDKVGQLLVRSESDADGSFWKDVSEVVQKEAAPLFKLIGESYAILSDTSKRQKYDAEEQLRKLRNGDSSSVNNAYMFPRTGRRTRDWDGGQEYANNRGQGASYAESSHNRRSRPYFQTSSSRRPGDGAGYGAYDWDDL